MYLVGFSCFYQGEITLKGVEWREKGRERKSERNYRVETGKKRRHYWKTEFSEIERGGGGRGSEGRELILP